MTQERAEELVRACQIEVDYLLREQDKIARRLIVAEDDLDEAIERRNQITNAVIQEE